MCVTGQIVLAENWYAYKYASMNWFLIDSDNDFSPIQCQAITWTNTDLLSIVL